MDQNKLIEQLNHVRHSQQDLQDYLRDLETWEENIKEEDETLKKQPQDGNKAEKLPPVRNSLHKKRYKKKKKVKEETVSKPKAKKIAGSDFRAWDKFDVEKACEEIDRESSESEVETDEEWEDERKRLLAEQHKEKGNQFLREDKLVEAIEEYTTAIDYNKESAVLPANRALALIKQGKYGAAEVDCNVSIALDGGYMKAYHRRGLARAALKRYKEAEEDFQQVLKMDPKNRATKEELDKVQKILNPPSIFKSLELEYDERCLCQLIYKPPHLRSKKPPVSLQIKEVNGEDEQEKWKKTVQATREQQSQASQQLSAQGLHEFDKFTGAVGKAEGATSVNRSHLLTNGQVINDCKNKQESPQTSSREQQKVLMSPADIGKISLKDSHGMSTSASDGSGDLKMRHETLPPVPKTFMQFMSVWTSLKKKPQEFYQYFKQIDPVLFPRLFGSSLEADVVVTILNCLRDHFLPEDLDPCPVLKNLLKVPRISVILMFLSKEDKEVLKNILQSVKNGEKHTAKELEQLQKDYGC